MKYVFVLYNTEIAAMAPWRGWKEDDVMHVVWSHTTEFTNDQPDISDMRGGVRSIPGSAYREQNSFDERR